MAGIGRSTVAPTGVNGSTKLVGVNLTTNSVDNIYYLSAITDSEDGIDGVRFNAAQTVACFSDTSGALVVLDLVTSEDVRLLANDSTAQAWYPMMHNDTLVPGHGAACSTSSVGLDQVEVSPDGKHLYYQPCNGGLY